MCDETAVVVGQGEDILEALAEYQKVLEEHYPDMVPTYMEMVERIGAHNLTVGEFVDYLKDYFLEMQFLGFKQLP